MRALPVLSGVTIEQRPSPRDGLLPAAILSVHSHGDRSFLDDLDLRLLSGSLRAAGVPNDLVVARLPRHVGEAASDEFDALVRVLREYGCLVYERVWDAGILVRLRKVLPDTVFIRLSSEHDLPGAPADYVCAASGGQVEAILAGLTGRAPSRQPTARYAPNLETRYVTENARPRQPFFVLRGSGGCPYGADARDNPLYADTNMPPKIGRGCAFCVTGNHYEHKTQPEALESVLEQMRYVRVGAPELKTLILKDENPFYYLTELIESAEREHLGPFSLLLETRADWFLQNRVRFERALRSAQRSSIRLAPFLVGIESFSQTELDRFNKGITAEQNIQFLESLRIWHANFAPALDLSHASFGFVMFTPWTTLGDLQANLDGIRASRLADFRGDLLRSRARLYPDTALYWLAERDGLLAPEYDRPSDDASARYGYLPARPWRFRDARVASIARLAEEYLSQHDQRDEVRLLTALLEQVGAAAEDAPPSIGQIERAVMQRQSPVVGTARSAVRFRDPPSLDPVAHALRVQIAEALVGARELPVQLPVFSVTLLTVEVDRNRATLVFGSPDPVVRIALQLPEGAERVQVDVELVFTPTGRWPTVARAIAARLERAITRDRWLRARPLIRELSATPAGVPLDFFRQAVDGVDPIQGLVRTGFRCNQDCGMCWQNRDWGRYDAEQVLRWIEDLRRAGAVSLIVSGGEPMLDPDLPRYVARAREIGIEHVTLETNAIQATRDGLAKRLAAAGVTGAFVSLHSGDPVTSDAITRAPGTHARTVAGIRALLEAKIPVRLNAVLTAEGLDELPGLPSFIRDSFGTDPMIQGLMLSYPTMPFDRALLPTVLPNPSRLRAALPRTIENALAVGVAVSGLDGPCGPPLCAFGADSRVRAGEIVGGRVPFRRYLPACMQCCVRAQCYGPRDADIEAFGDACVQPIRDLDR